MSSNFLAPRRWLRFSHGLTCHVRGFTTQRWQISNIFARVNNVSTPSIRVRLQPAGFTYSNSLFKHWFYEPRNMSSCPKYPDSCACRRRTVKTPLSFLFRTTKDQVWLRVTQTRSNVNTFNSLFWFQQQPLGPVAQTRINYTDLYAFSWQNWNEFHVRFHIWLVW